MIDAPHCSVIETASEPGRDTYDAVVIGSGPNGLAAAAMIAEAGRSVLLVESSATIGGGTRTAELTLPGFRHDVCSAIHPLGVASPFFKRFELERFGLEWIHSPLAAAHPLGGAVAVAVDRSLEATAAQFGTAAKAYENLLAPLVKNADALLEDLLGPIRLPSHPLLMTRFARWGLGSAAGMARRHLRDEGAAGMFAGMAAHSILPLESIMTAGVGVMFCVSAHTVGWPLPRGGSQAIADALARYIQHHGGEIVTSMRAVTLRDLPNARAYLFDTNTAQVGKIAGDELPAGFRRRLERFRHGPGIFKLDWALDGPIPWLAEACHRAATVHVGGNFASIAKAERAAWSGAPAEEPFVLLAQTSLFDDTRAPKGKHTGWAYCHVPHGSTVDMTERIEAMVERYAPGFRERIIGRHVTSPADLYAYNANCVGGDITGGVMDFGQMLARPSLRWNPYTTPSSRVYLCSSSTPPGGGVHGMCGYHAAQAALARVLRD